MRATSAILRKIIMILAPILLVLLAGPISCAAHPAVTDILNQAVSTMENLTSYHLDSNVLWKYTTIGGSDPGTSSILWLGDDLFDTKNKELHKLMQIEDTDSTGGKTHWTVESYNAGGYSYYKADSDAGVSNTFNVWFKSKADNTDWADFDPVNLICNLMKASNETTLTRSEKINGVECYVLDIHPSVQTIADWIGNQFQGFGGIDYSTGPGLHGEEDYLRFFKTGTFEIWVTKNNFLVMKANINPQFTATAKELGNVPGIPQYIDWTSVKSEFQGEMSFSAFNQPANITVPPEALNGVDRDSPS